MNYKDARYSAVMFYTCLKLSDLRNKPDIWNKVLKEYIDKIENIELKYSGFLYYEGLNIQGLRKRKYDRRKGLTAITSQLKGSEKAFGLYVYDKAFSKEHAPSFLVNIYASDSEKIEGRILRASSAASPMGTFFLVASSINSIKINEFKVYSQNAFNLLEGVRGFVLDDVNFFYEEFTSFELAYHNISSRLKSGNLDEWHPAGGIELAHKIHT